MKTIQTTVCAAAAAFALGIAVLPAARAADVAATQPTTQPTAATNAKCPVTGDDIDPKITTVYNGKTYAFCCADCVKLFDADPAKYAAKAK